jgi:hypothetical protein
MVQSYINTSVKSGFRTLQRTLVATSSGHTDARSVRYWGRASGRRWLLPGKLRVATTRQIRDIPYEMSMLMNVRLAARHSLRLAYPLHTRSFFGLFKRKEQRLTEPKPLLNEDNLFHPFSKSPFPAIRARGEAIKQLAPCPVCSSSSEHVHAHTKAQPKAVGFECPDCGWPTHCSEEHWATDQEHQKYCSRLREVNEDEHDLRSGRKLHEFDLPGIVFFTS